MPDPLPDDVLLLAADFQNARPRVPADLALELWREWRLRRPGQRFLETEEQNVALLLHARAHGAWVPERGEASYEGELLARHSESFRRFETSPLPWGPAANLDPVAGAALDSPVLDVWVFRSQELPTLLLITGTGLPEIRARVLPAVFMASLRIGTTTTDLVNVGALRVEYPVAGRRAEDLPLSVLDPFRDFVPTAQEALEGREPLHALINELQDLAHRTGLVRMHSADFDAQQELAARLKVLATDAGYGDPAIWAPGALVVQGRDAPAAGPMVVLEPYRHIGSGQQIRLPFHGDLLASPAYRKLAQAFEHATLDSVLADVTARWEYHDQEVTRLTAEEAEYLNTPEADRLEKYGPTVLLTYEYDPETDLLIRLAYPKEVDTHTFYTRDVPSQITSHMRWRLQMEGIERSIKAAALNETAPVKRLAASRFLDAAIRRRHPDESATIRMAFSAWCEQVQPMLWFEWRRHLERLGVEPEQVFTRHTVVRTLLERQPDQSLRLMMAPLGGVSGAV